MWLQSYTGKELLRILFANKIKPIVLIAFTNHALDHMLNSILDAKITDKIVRLGSRSTDERIGEYSLWNLEKTSQDTSMNGQIKREYAIKKKTEEGMYKVLDDIQIPEPTEEQIKEYLQVNWHNHLSMMYDPPFWIVEYADRSWRLEGEEGEWMVQGKKGKARAPSHLMARTYYGFWKRGLDIAFIRPPQPSYIEVQPWNKPKQQKTQPDTELVPPTQEEWDMYHERMFEFFDELGFGNSVPPVPAGNRPFVQLQDSPTVWSMSLEERQRLAEYWEDEMRRLAYQNHLDDYRALRKQYEEACERYEAVSDEVRVQSAPKCYPAEFSGRGGVIYWETMI